MVDYYKVLKVSNNASRAEIRSAYRRLARRKHPDLNDGDPNASREFAHIAKAYQVLSNPKERADYDKLRLRKRFSEPDTVFNSDNPHARKVRQMAYERRYNAIIDRMVAEERKEQMALQRTIFPVVALFVSTIFAAAFKPQFWINSNVLGKIAIVTLFVVGILHLAKRLQASFERYTYSAEDIHDSILEGIEEENRPYSRSSAVVFLVVGTGLCVAIGLLLRSIFGLGPSPLFPGMFADQLTPELIFYPPIVVLLVDILHRIAVRTDHV
ncbi:MAG: J domain-containing protein [Acidobacteria bacterium]|nr:MAG: J domain-containing protein [Acidobacteriota bacterium]REK01235.1 MAG: J domain-containing protein [Acidobacteriota bacterium]REK14191.1 MAG: J domain-containing protein [Acidobacteriota bacterium]REK44906.1 MAG: J domain-containing protein [Acidobacteriota bacterium]